MNALRAIVVNHRLDRVRSSDIRQEFNISDITKFVRNRLKQSDEHVSRADDNTLIKIARDYRRLSKRNGLIVGYFP